MKQNVQCPYLQNGICYHAHCIYKPDLQCNKRETIKISKKDKTRVKSVKIRGERGNGKFSLLRKEDDTE